MTPIDSLKRIQHLLSVPFGIAFLFGLAACGGVETETKFNAVDPTAPVNDWELVWSDEFDTSTINSANWTHEVNCEGGGNQEQQCYTDSSENSFVADGLLNIVAKPAEDGAQLPYTSARLNTKNKVDWKYGRFEMRAKLPQGQGTWPAFWMMPTYSVYGEWPRSGEIDILEAVNLKTVDSEGVAEASVVGQLYYGSGWPNQSGTGKEYDLPNNLNPADDFHTYAIEWQEGEIRWYVDGYLFQTQRASTVRYNSKGEAVGLKHKGWFAEFFDPITGELIPHYGAAPFDQEFFIILNLAVGGAWPENTNNLGIDPTVFENGQTYQIDYVRAYECSIDPISGAGCETIRAGYDSFEDAMVEGDAPIPSPPAAPTVSNLVIFDGTLDPNWTAWDCCGGSTPAIVVDSSLGNVYEFSVGANPTVNGFISRDEFLGDSAEATPFDATGLLEFDGTVSFDMKVVTAPNDSSAAWLFKIESEGGSTAVELPLADSVEGVAPATGEWQTYTYNLSDLADAGLDISAIDVVMIFPAWGVGEGAVYHVTNVEIGSDAIGGSPALTIFDDAENINWPMWDCCGGSTPTVETDDAEHGAVAEFSIGASPTVMGFISRAEFITDPAGVPSPFDASAILSNGVIQFEMKVATAPIDSNAVWKFKVESVDAATAVELDLSASVEAMPPTTGEWQTYTFNLSDLATAGLDVSAIDVIMIFPAWGTGEGAVYRVDNAKIYDPNAASGFNGHVLFADQALDQWSIWDCCGGSTPTIENDDAEHGLTAEFVIGASPTVMGLLADDNVYLDASDLLAEGVVQFEMKVVNAPNDTNAVWKFKIESGDTTGAVELDLTASQEGQAPTTGQWQTYTYTLQELFDAGLDIGQIDVLMVFPAWGSGEGAVYRLDNVKIYDPSSLPAPQRLVLYQDAQNPLWQIWDCCGGSTPTEETDDAEHGSTAEFVIGAAPTVMGFTSREGHGVVGGVPYDATDSLQSGVVQFEMKVTNAPNDTGSTWMFKIEAGDGTSAVELPLTASNEGASPVTGDWQTYTFTLQDLFDAGLDISAIDVVMVFPAWGTGEGAVYRIDNAIIGAP